jgi:hypothetical protein
MRSGVCDSVSLVWGQHMESLTKAVDWASPLHPSQRLQIGLRIGQDFRPLQTRSLEQFTLAEENFSYFVSAVLNPIFCP